MNTINMRLGNLELRNEKNLGSGERYLEIVEWIQPDSCITIAIFIKDKEGYFLKSVGDRIALEQGDWHSLGILVKNGFDFLKQDAKGVGDEQ